MSAPARPTLLTSPLSFADFVFRLAFFLLAPVAIVVVAELFPVRGALIDVGLALGVFLAGEALRGRVRRWKPLSFFLGEAFHFEAFYRERPPRPFAYYVFYPLLFPYWLWQREARREFLVFRSYTLISFLLLIASLVYQYFTQWYPELGWRDFLPFVLLSLLVETVLVLALLMPIATTVVWYHTSFRRKRLLVVLLAGLASTALALAYVGNRRDPIISYATRERVRLRTAREPNNAHRALKRALATAIKEAVTTRDVEGDGKVSGPALERARSALETFYKHDEAYAFDLWASPLRNPRTLVIYFEARPHKPPIWVALNRSGEEIRSAKALPHGAFDAMRHASGEDDDALWDWSDELSLDDETTNLHRRSRKSTARPGPSQHPSSIPSSALPQLSNSNIQGGSPIRSPLAP